MSVNSGTGNKVTANKILFSASTYILYHYTFSSRNKRIKQKLYTKRHTHVVNNKKAVMLEKISGEFRVLYCRLELNWIRKVLWPAISTYCKARLLLRRMIISCVMPACLPVCVSVRLHGTSRFRRIFMKLYFRVFFENLYIKLKFH
jgi:hypothetical protein